MIFQKENLPEQENTSIILLNLYKILKHISVIVNNLGLYISEHNVVCHDMNVFSLTASWLYQGENFPNASQHFNKKNNPLDFRNGNRDNW